MGQDVQKIENNALLGILVGVVIMSLPITNSTIVLVGALGLLLYSLYMLKKTPLWNRYFKMALNLLIVLIAYTTLGMLGLMYIVAIIRPEVIAVIYAIVGLIISFAMFYYIYLAGDYDFVVQTKQTVAIILSIIIAINLLSTLRIGFGGSLLAMLSQIVFKIFVILSIYKLYQKNHG